MMDSNVSVITISNIINERTIWMSLEHKLQVCKIFNLGVGNNSSSLISIVQS